MTPKANLSAPVRASRPKMVRGDQRGRRQEDKLALNELARVLSASDAGDKSLGSARSRGKVAGGPKIVDCKNRYFHYLVQPC